MDGSSAGVVVRWNMGWRKLEKRREEKKLLFGWRLQRMSEDKAIEESSRLVKWCLGW